MYKALILYCITNVNLIEIYMLGVFLFSVGVLKTNVGNEEMRIKTIDGWLIHVKVCF